MILSFNSFGQKEFDYKNIIGHPIESLGVFHRVRDNAQRPGSGKVFFYKYYNEYTWYNRKMGYANIITDSNNIIKSVQFYLEKTMTRDLFDALVDDFGEPTKIMVRIEPPVFKSLTELHHKTKHIKKYCDAASNIDFKKDSLEISTLSYSNNRTIIKLKAQ